MNVRFAVDELEIVDCGDQRVYALDASSKPSSGIINVISINNINKDQISIKSACIQAYSQNMFFCGDFFWTFKGLFVNQGLSRIFDQGR